MSSGLGRKSTTASSSVCTPLFLKAEPVTTGTIFNRKRALAKRGANLVFGEDRPRLRGTSPSDRRRPRRRLRPASRAPPSPLPRDRPESPSISYSAPFASSFQMSAFIVIRSTTPLNWSSRPIGICIATGFAPRRSMIDSNERSNEAPARSSLLIKQIRGTPYLSA